MSAFPRVKARSGKIVSLAIHAAESIASGRRLRELAPVSPVARALLAVIDDAWDSQERAAFARIESTRADLYRRADEIFWEIENPLDPKTVYPSGHQVVGIEAKKCSVKPHWGQILYALVREARPHTVLELGTCFGISGLFIQAALARNGAGRLVTMEGSRARAEIAQGLYRSHGFADAHIEVGDFNRTLRPLLERSPEIDLAFIDGNHQKAPTLEYDSDIRAHASADAVLVHDDIRWNEDMLEAWRAIERRPASRVFDIFRIGAIELSAPQPNPQVIRAWLGLSHVR